MKKQKKPTTARQLAYQERLQAASVYLRDLFGISPLELHAWYILQQHEKERIAWNKRESNDDSCATLQDYLDLIVDELIFDNGSARGFIWDYHNELYGMLKRTGALRK